MKGSTAPMRLLIIICIMSNKFRDPASTFFAKSKKCPQTFRLLDLFAVEDKHGGVAIFHHSQQLPVAEACQPQILCWRSNLARL